MATRKSPKSAKPPSPARRHSPPSLLRYPHTDTGNAERLVKMFKGQIRFCPEWKRWLIWDGTRWKPDYSGEIRCFANDAIRTFYAQVPRVRSADIRKKAEVHARKSESDMAIRAMLSCAESELGISVNASDLDRDPWLLNCQNGTIDLHTGGLRPHRQADLITKLCPVIFDRSAECPRFLAFLSRIMGGKQDLVDYLQKIFGYALTGSVGEKACFCFFGGGDNGKTTLLELFRDILADYSAEVMIDSLMSRSRDSNASMADIADLRGARFVTTSETEEQQKLAEGKIKYLTGMSEIKTCRKYENPFTFPPTHKIFMDANHRPIVRGSDQAIWSRLKLVPFTVTIPKDERDKELRVKLRAEASGVLAWAIQGCLAWQRDSLVDPPEVSASVDVWKNEDDPFTEFFEDCCEFDRAHSTAVTQMWLTFATWAAENGVKDPARSKLCERLRKQGCVKGRPLDSAGKQVRSWMGVKLV